MTDGVSEPSLSIKPVGDHLVVKVVDDGEYSEEHGFALPKNYHQKPMVGKVVEISDDFDNDGLRLRVGDTVLLPKYGSTGIRTERGEYQLAHRKDIIGVI